MAKSKMKKERIKLETNMPFWGRLNLLYPIGAKITGTNKKEHKTAEIKLGKESILAGYVKKSQNG